MLNVYNIVNMIRDINYHTYTYLEKIILIR